MLVWNSGIGYENQLGARFLGMVFDLPSIRKWTPIWREDIWESWLFCKWMWYLYPKFRTYHVHIWINGFDLVTWSKWSKLWHHISQYFPGFPKYEFAVHPYIVPVVPQETMRGMVSLSVWCWDNGSMDLTHRNRRIDHQHWDLGVASRSFGKMIVQEVVWSTRFLFFKSS